LAIGAGAVLTPAAARAQPPRLVVLVSIDQFPREYLDRFGRVFATGGFRRLLEQGADYRECHHEHLATFTGPGHAVMLTGAYPVHTGIVDNSWYSRAAGREVGCVEDARATTVCSPSAQADEPSQTGVAPPASLSTTVGDALRLGTDMRARVVSAAIKERSAVLMGGQRPNGAYWFDARTCTFVTSTYYMDRLPGWLDQVNARQLCKPYVGQSWSKVRSDLDYARYADTDDAVYERPPFGLGRTFPHPIKEVIRNGANAMHREKDRYNAVVSTPAGGDVLLQLAVAAIDGEQLGADDVPDILALGFSSNDIVGHAYGTQSQEVLDVTLRTDRTIAQLVDTLDAKIGRDRWLLVLTSDHGIAPIPEYLEQQRLIPAREDHYRRTGDAARSIVERALAQRFFATAAPPPTFRNFITAWLPPFVYVSPQTPAVLPGTPSFDELLHAVRDETMKLDGVKRVYVRGERFALAVSNDPFDRRVYRSWHAENGGDLVVVMDPYWLDTESAATTHGSPYRYDTHVPMLLYGAGVRAGRYDRPVAVVDLAVTLSRVLGVTPPPMSEGEVLREALL
jgi:predicted AlkP superfamily pyrophosphatase or phosphodiesterase